MKVEVEVLDVNEEEARALLLSIDPLAALDGRRPYDPKKEGAPMGPEQWLVIVTCRDEAHQVEILKRFQGEISCRRSPSRRSSMVHPFGYRVIRHFGRAF
jgi:hypothetical protein